MATWHGGSEVLDMVRPWQWRVVRASMGSTTGLIVMAMLARTPRKGPALGQWCNITAEGQVETQIRNFGGWQSPRPIGDLISVRDNLRRLADHCKLPDVEREALFEEFRKWVRKDYRATSGEPIVHTKVS